MTAFTLTQHFDDPELDFTTRFPLPYLENFGALMRVHDAVHKASVHRKAVAVIGPKGMGKSVRLLAAKGWYETMERTRNAKNSNYAPQRMIIRKSSRKDQYEGTLAALSLHLDSRAAIKDRGRKKEPSQLIEQIVVLLHTKHVRVLALDEGEVLKKDTINAYRDVVAAAADMGEQYGVGLVITGTRECETLLQGQDEYGHRIVEVIRVPPVSVTKAHAALLEWLPEAKGLTGQTADAFRNVTRLEVCQDRPTNMRRLEGIVTEYARRLQLSRRLRDANGWADVPIDVELLRVVSQSYVNSLPELHGEGGKHA